MTVEELYWLYYEHLMEKNLPCSGISLIRKGRLSRIEVSELDTEAIDVFVRTLYAQGFNAHNIKYTLTILQEALAWLRTKRNRDRSRKWREEKNEKSLDRRPEVITVARTAMEARLARRNA